MAILAMATARGLEAQDRDAAPTAAECDAWARDLAGGGDAALRLLTFQWIARCPSAPTILAAAVRAARVERDTAYLGRLAAQAGAVRDAAVFAAALQVAGERRSSDRARVMGLLVAARHLGSAMEVPGRPRSQLFTETLPAEGACGLGISSGGPSVDTGLPEDAPLRAARVMDGIRYGDGESVFLRNFARCARSAAWGIPPQPDLGRVRVQHVCGTRFRVQNRTPMRLVLGYVVDAAGGRTEEALVVANPTGGWTEFDVEETGTLHVHYNGDPVATVANRGKRCGPDG